MTEIVDYALLKQQRYIEKECSLKQKQNIDLLVDQQTITIKEHATLLNMLKIIDDKKHEAKIIFQDAFELDRKTFEKVYKLNWWTVVQHSLIFLKILKDNKPADYQLFFKQ